MFMVEDRKKNIKKQRREKKKQKKRIHIGKNKKELN